MKKRKTKIIHRNPWWDYKKDTTLTDCDKEACYFYGESPGNSMVIPIAKDGRFTLIKQKRYLKNKTSWEFPSGWINRDETPQQAARRELEEESCHKTKNLRFIKCFEASPGIFKNACHLFVAKKVEKIKNCQTADREIDAVAYYSYKKVEELIKKNKIWAGQTLAAWAIFNSQFKKR